MKVFSSLSAALPRDRRLVTVALVCCISIGIATLVFLGHRAMEDSQRSARLLLERRSTEQLALLWAALGQDMRGVQNKVLMPLAFRKSKLEQPYELAEIFARGFARFPYPESFFVWKPSIDGNGVTSAFNRAERPPPWDASARLAGPYPVSVILNAPAMRELIAVARDRAHDDNWPLVVFQTQIGGIPYQVVVRPLFEGRDSDSAQTDGRLVGLIGFTVNLDWVRRFYFRELVRQVSRIGGQPNDVSLAILDERGVSVMTSQPGLSDTPPLSRRFPLIFADRDLLQNMNPDDVHFWSAQATAGGGSRWAATATGPGMTFVLLSAAAVIAVVALLTTARGAWAAAELATMKSDFVASVTHDLKTPLAIIQLIADTLIRGHYDSQEAVRQYATLLGQECQNFSRLIDNLLTYARLGDNGARYTFEPLDVHDLLEDALEEFRPILLEQKFAVRVEMPDELPSVRGDRSALLQAVRNLIDNAVKYSDQTRLLEIGACRTTRGIVIRVRDQGRGIRDDELGQVCEKFVRGSGARSRGSGLGLAIVRRIVDAHGGLMTIESAPAEGTRVDVLLPVAS